MTIKFGKIFLIVIIGLKITEYLLGYPIISFVYDQTNLEYSFNISSTILINAGFLNTLSYIPQFIIAIWCYSQAKKIAQDKWTWFLMGLVYDKYLIVFLIVILIFQKKVIQFNLNRSIKIFLVLLIIAIPLSYGLNQFTSIYLNAKYGVAINAAHSVYSHYLKMVSTGLMIIVNIALSIKFEKMMRSIGETKRLVWIIATLILNIFPIILYNHLKMLQIKKTA